MAATSDVGSSQTLRSRWLLASLLLATIFITLAVTFAFNRGNVVRPLFELSDMAGPATQSLLKGHGLTVCTEAMGTIGNPICFHAAHMPMTPLVLALGIKLLGNHFLRVSIFKALLLLIPVDLAIYLVWRRMLPDPGRWFVAGVLLLVPFATPAFLACVVNLTVEEGCSYSFLALSTAILFFAEGLGLPLTLVFALALDCLYLSKSSMSLAVLVLLVGYVLMERSAMLRLLTVVLVLAAPFGWAIYQYHSSGRFTIGTSLDGMNLHKGNNPAFLEHYPPALGETLDWFDQDLNRGQQFSDEWSFNDYHRHAAIDYMVHHPRETLIGDLRKLRVLFISVRKVGSSRVRGIMLIWETATLVVFRLILWTAIGSAFYAAFRTGRYDPSSRLVAGIFLALVAACTLPYVAGFAFTRHVSILIYPASLMCCRMLSQSDPCSSRQA